MRRHHGDCVDDCERRGGYDVPAAAFGLWDRPDKDTLAFRNPVRRARLEIQYHNNNRAQQLLNLSRIAMHFLGMAQFFYFYHPAEGMSDHSHPGVIGKN
jgi:hypothetical protein